MNSPGQPLLAREPSPPTSHTSPGGSSIDDIDEGRLPPRGGLPLGALLGVSISVLVALLLGGLTAIQLHREERSERATLQELLAESLAPLAAELERASNLGEFEQDLASSARAEIARGPSDFNLTLRSGDDRVVASALTGRTLSPPPGSLRAEMSVSSPFLASGRGTLTVWQNGSELATEMADRRHGKSLSRCGSMTPSRLTRSVRWTSAPGSKTRL